VRRREARRLPDGRDVTPAVGKRGEPGTWRRAVDGARVALARPRWGDARWSYLYRGDTRYAPGAPGVGEGAAVGGRGEPAARDGTIAAAARRMRSGRELPTEVHGPMIHAAVWTWEVPLYFWFGGMATGSAFVAFACDVAGEDRSAALARKITLAAVGPCAPLLVLDLGRPLRFLHMLRIFKTRSPMSMGAWCLSAFSGTAAGAVGADLLGRPRLARLAGAATAMLGTYLGSYTGVLLASTATPVWARSRALLPPIFICTATATGAAVNRLALAALGTPPDDPARTALGALETAAMTAELTLSTVNERRLGPLARALEHGRPGAYMRLAKWATRAGLALRLARRGAGAQHASSILFALAALGFRFAWVEGGKASAHDDEAVAANARSRA
jgi:formate-dependent nitrite reductase membrane component NrfD